MNKKQKKIMEILQVSEKGLVKQITITEEGQRNWNNINHAEMNMMLDNISKYCFLLGNIKLRNNTKNREKNILFLELLKKRQKLMKFPKTKYGIH